MEHTYWEEAAEAAVQLIHSEVRFKPRADLTQLRTDFEEMVDEFFHTPSGSDKMIVRWSVIGADAWEIGIQKQFDFSIKRITKILVGKQRDYGSENIRRFGRQGLCIRGHDKVARLENLWDASGAPQNESLEDTLIDIVGYSAIGIMWESQSFLLPLKSRV